MPAPYPSHDTYQFQLLRYSPAPISGEFYNIAVILSGPNGEVIDARFASEFKRMECHPAADLGVLRSLRAEFEEKRLLGEGFSAYLKEVRKNLSDGFHLSATKAFHGGDPLTEMERLMKAYVETPPGLHERSDGAAPGSRLAIRSALDETFKEHRLLQALDTDLEVPYGGRLKYRFDYGYSDRQSQQRLIHAIGRRGEVVEATRLCFVHERWREAAESPGGLTVVVDDEASEEVRELFVMSKIEPRSLSEVDDLAQLVRAELGL